jgi:hypothetical protein
LKTPAQRPADVLEILVGLVKVSDAGISASIQGKGWIFANHTIAVYCLNLPGTPYPTSIFEIAVEFVEVSDVGITGGVQGKRRVFAHSSAGVYSLVVPGRAIVPGIIQKILP